MAQNQHLSVFQTPQDQSIDPVLVFGDDDKSLILIVDDEEMVRKLFVSGLSEFYNCVEAASVNEALGYIAETEFALVITDVIMPGLSGIELLRKITENYPYTQVVMVSGVGRSQRALDAIRLGAFDYLIKPCDLDVLQLTVERALERRILLINARQYKIDLEMRNTELARGKAELERLQSQIVHSEKMASLGQLSAGIAHELNNPVGFIYGNLEILNVYIAGLVELLNYYDQSELSEKVAVGANSIKNKIDYEAVVTDLNSIISDCHEGTRRIKDIVQNLRTFSRLDEAEFSKSDVHEGIDSTIRLLSRYYGNDNITLKRDYGHLPQIDIYGGQLNQVWMNLLVNAAQAVGTNGGEVCITTRHEEESVIITISDTGCGISRDDLNRIFDPFFTTKPVGEGTGLGLSISVSIVERHHGTLNVESEINKGTTFTILLPITNMAQRTEEKTDQIYKYYEHK